MKGSTIPAPAFERFATIKDREELIRTTDNDQAKLLTGCPVNEFSGFVGPTIENVIYFPWDVENADGQSVNRGELRKQTILAIEKAKMALNACQNVYVDLSQIDYGHTATSSLALEDSTRVYSTIVGFLARHCDHRLSTSVANGHLKRGLLYGYGGIEDHMLSLDSRHDDLRKAMASWIEDVKAI